MSLMEKAGAATPDTGDKTPPAAGTGEATPPAGSPPPAATPPATDWYYDDNIKGTGERPDWLKEKYKTATEQAKAYNEVEKKLGAFKGAPDEYDLAIEGYPDLQFSQDDPLLKGFIEDAKANGVSQEYVTKLLGTYAQALTINIPNADEEMKKIGPNAVQDMQILSQWAGNILSPEEHKQLAAMVTTADTFRLFDKLRQSMSQSDVAPPGGGTPYESVEQVTALISDPRYDTDEHFRADVRRRMSIALARKPKGK